MDDRNYRDELRELAQSVIDDPRLWRCGKEIVRADPSGSRLVLDTKATVLYCGRAWLCPVCGTLAARELTKDLCDVLTSWTKKGGSVALLTLTQKHSAEDELVPLWSRLGMGWSTVVQSARWRSDRQAFGIRGSIRVTEVVRHRDRGWNVHYHTPLLLDRALDENKLTELKDRLGARFITGIRNAGGVAHSIGQDLRAMAPGSEAGTAVYLSKGTTICRSDESRTPQAILADLKITGEGIELLDEFNASVTTVKRKRVSPSRSLAKLLELEPCCTR